MRRFYVFNDPNTVREHISKISTVEDVYQLDYDIFASDTNLVYLRCSLVGIWGLYYADGLGPFKLHLFIPECLKWAPDKGTCDSYSLLEGKCQS